MLGLRGRGCGRDQGLGVSVGGLSSDGHRRFSEWKYDFSVLMKLSEDCAGSWDCPLDTD